MAKATVSITDFKIKKQIEVSYTSSGKAYARFGVPLSRKKGDGDFITNWLNCVAFGDEAEKLGSYAPGTTVGIECNASPDEYTSRNGQKVASISYMVDRISSCIVENAAPQTPQNTQSSAEGFMSILDTADSDGMPFS